MGDKQEWSDNRYYVITDSPTRDNVYLLLSEMLWHIKRNLDVWLYISPNDKTSYIVVQLQPNDRFSNCVLLYWLYKLYCSGRLEEVHRVIDCS